MMKLRKLIMCFALVLCLINATSKPIIKKDRIYHEVPLSTREHDDSKNFDYDHEAFLGKDEAKNFDNLAPTESKNRLGLLVERIDEDKDGYVTEEEMKKWIKQVQNRWMYEDVDRHWKRYDINEDGLVSWDEYKNNTYRYAYVDPDRNDGASRMAAREERRFQKADQDGDMKVNKEEFAAFLHPEHYEHMKDLLVQEALDDMDANGDGVIDLDEYIGDMYKYMGDQEMDPENQWLKTAKEHFADFRDKNKDGKMDKEEIRDWILPNTDYAGSEAKHLVHLSDADKDGRLTKSEILDKYNLFVGSMATDFGNALHHHHHDEF